MSHPLALTRNRTGLLVIDMQEKFAPVIAGFDDIVENIARMALTFKMFKMPVIVTEQNPKGLGATVATIRSALGEYAPVTKMAFACTRDPNFAARLAQTGVDTLVVTGIETHVCVMQTVLDLLASGIKVHIAVDAISTRKGLDHRMGIDRMVKAGAAPTTSEAVMFELLESAAAPEFKSVQQMIKGRAKRSGDSGLGATAAVAAAPVAPTKMQSVELPVSQVPPPVVEDVFATVAPAPSGDMDETAALPPPGPKLSGAIEQPKAHGDDMEVLDIETLVDLRDMGDDSDAKK